MNERLVGRFYFKLESNGNLIGRYSNNTLLDTFPESAQRTDDTNLFVGNYDATWQEVNGETASANLVITFKEGSEERLYTFIWRRGNTIVFWGEGFLADDTLLGDYRNFETI